MFESNHRDNDHSRLYFGSAAHRNKGSVKLYKLPDISATPAFRLEDTTNFVMTRKNNKQKKKNHLEPMLHCLLQQERSVRRDMCTNRLILSSLLNTIKQYFMKNDIFKLIYANYGLVGSVADRLKVKKADEFDVEFKFRSSPEWQVKLSNVPSFVNVFMNPKTLHKDLCYEFFTDDGYICVSKIYNWFQNICDEAIHRMKFNRFTVVKVLRKNGPAVTLRVTPRDSCAFDVDLVPKFVFESSQLPQEGYRRCHEEFAVVPLNPMGSIPGKSDIYCKLSFTYEERKIMFNKYALKPSIRIMKMLISKQDIPIIKCYMLKTCAFWILEDDSSAFKCTLANAFIKMLERLVDYVSAGNLPDYWNKKHNLIESIEQENRNEIVKRLVIIKNIVQNSNNPVEIVRYVV